MKKRIDNEDLEGKDKDKLERVAVDIAIRKRDIEQHIIQQDFLGELEVLQVCTDIFVLSARDLAAELMRKYARRIPRNHIWRGSHKKDSCPPITNHPNLDLLNFFSFARAYGYNLAWRRANHSLGANNVHIFCSRAGDCAEKLFVQRLFFRFFERAEADCCALIREKLEL